MTPREIHLKIEELVLHGFAGRSKWEIAQAIESELRGMLAAHGIPAAWQASPSRIDAGRIEASGHPGKLGRQIAQAVYRDNA